jgi:hypothetical protein
MKDDNEELQDEEELPDSRPEPGYHLIKIGTSPKITTAMLYQLEYLFSQSISNLEQHIKTEIVAHGLFHISYFGDLGCMKSFTEKIKNTPFTLISIEPYDLPDEGE